MSGLPICFYKRSTLFFLGMNTNSRPASLTGNLIARNPSAGRQKYSYWVPDQLALPQFITMSVREVTHDTTVTECVEPPRYVFENPSIFNRRQIFASRTYTYPVPIQSPPPTQFEPWLSAGLRASGWVPFGGAPVDVAYPLDWLMVDMLQEYEMTKMFISGHGILNFWVTTFKVAYRSNWGDTFTVDETVYTGNTDPATVLQVVFTKPIYARFLKVTPLTWNGIIALRWSVFGCPRSPRYNEGLVRVKF